MEIFFSKILYWTYEWFLCRFGRLKVFYIAVAIQVAGGCVAAFSPNVYFFYVIYFIQGVVQVAVYLSVYVLGKSWKNKLFNALRQIKSVTWWGRKLLLLMNQSVTFYFYFALGIKPSDITFSACLTAHASTWLISNHFSPYGILCWSGIQ